LDSGAGPTVRDPHIGKFGGPLSSAGFDCTTQTRTQLHEGAFRRLGCGVYVVLDNLAERVLEPDIYDSALNPLHCDEFAHCVEIALPCRVGDLIESQSRLNEAQTCLDQLVTEVGRYPGPQDRAAGVGMLAEALLPLILLRC
jgi:hypothetical protein